MIVLKNNSIGKIQVVTFLKIIKMIIYLKYKLIDSYFLFRIFFA